MDVVHAADAPLGRSDATRRWRLADAPGWSGFPGVTTVEGDRVAAALGGLDPGERGRRLVAVELGVVLSDGAGPYLVAEDGALVLVVGAHPVLPGVSVAMGPGGTGRQRIGAAEPAPEGAGLWRWRAVAEVPEARRVAALDALAAADDPAALVGWADAWASAA